MRHRLMRTIAPLVVVAMLGSGCAFLSRAGAPTPPAQAVSGGDQAVLSGNGRFVAFTSASPDLVNFDNNSLRDVFVRDRDTGIVERLAECEFTSCGVEFNGVSQRPAISGTGRYVVYQSVATNAVPSDTNAVSDIFLRDRDAPTTTRVSVTDGEAQANGASRNAKVSDDGRFVIFESDATNLVAGDTNAVTDVFVRDLVAGTTTRVSVATAGTQGNALSQAPSISSDARYVTFESYATTLVAGDTNGFRDVFVRDRQTSTTTRVSISTGGTQADGEGFEPAISANGRYVAFTSNSNNLIAGDTNFFQDIFLRDRQTSTTTRVSVSTAGAQSSSASGGANLSSDGRYVAFNSLGNNLVPGDTNGVHDLFLRDILTSTTTRVSLTNGGGQANGVGYEASLSANGRLLAFSSTATNLVSNDSNGLADVFLRDLNAATTTRQSENAEPHTVSSGLIFPSPSPALSDDGRYVAFTSSADNLVPGDTNLATDIFVRDFQTNTVARVSVASGGAQANGDSFDPQISGDGRYVVFASHSSNLVTGDTNGFNDIFVRDRTNGTTARVSMAPGAVQLNSASGEPDISDNGRYVVYRTAASNAYAGDTNGVDDIVINDAVTTLNFLMSITTGGVPGNGGSRDPRIIGNGSVVTFTSASTNIGSGTDTNIGEDAFVRDGPAGTTERISNTNGGVDALNALSQAIAADATGRYVLFVSLATNAVAGDTNGFADTFLRDRVTGTNERVSVGTGGTQASGTYGAISSDARWVAFISGTAIVPADTNGRVDIYLRDRLNGRTTLASTTGLLGAGNGNSGQIDTPALSGDARYVAFGSSAQLVAGDSGDTTLCCGDELYVRAAIVPTVSGVTGATVARGATATVTVNGTNFLTGVGAFFGNSITVNSTNRISESQVQLNITVAANAGTGPRAVLVFNIGTGAGLLSGAAAAFTLTVT